MDSQRPGLPGSELPEHVKPVKPPKKEKRRPKPVALARESPRDPMAVRKRQRQGGSAVAVLV